MYGRGPRVNSPSIVSAEGGVKKERPREIVVAGVMHRESFLPRAPVRVRLFRARMIWLRVVVRGFRFSSNELVVLNFFVI